MIEEVMSPPVLVKKRSKIEASGLRLEKRMSKHTSRKDSDHEQEEEKEEDNSDDEEVCPDCGESLWDCEGHDDEAEDIIQTLTGPGYEIVT
jgi:hypothetical protein